MATADPPSGAAARRSASRVASPKPKLRSVSGKESAKAAGAELEELQRRDKAAAGLPPPKLTRQVSIYALQPDGRWLRPSWAFPLLQQELEKFQLQNHRLRDSEGDAEQALQDASEGDAEQANRCSSHSRHRVVPSQSLAHHFAWRLILCFFSVLFGMCCNARYAACLAVTFLLCLVWQPSFQVLRLQYTLVGAGLLLYRMYYYARKEWVLFFIDLCFVNSILLIVSLWFCTEGTCSQEWLLAVYLVAQGPVAGATFPLQTPLTLHHPEAFESFFLHASPMWMSYAIRWRWGGFEQMPTVGSLMSLGFRRIYLPWSTLYLIFLLCQPIFPDKIAGYETLVDGLILPQAKSAEQRLVAKRQDYWSYAKKVLFAVALHCLLSGSGFLAASLAYQYHEVQLVWIACVFLSCLMSGARFYYQSAVPQYEPPGLAKGFVNMAIAWAFVLPTYCHAAGYLS